RRGWTPQPRVAQRTLGNERSFRAKPERVLQRAGTGCRTLSGFGRMGQFAPGCAARPWAVEWNPFRVLVTRPSPSLRPAFVGDLDDFDFLAVRSAGLEGEDFAVRVLVGDRDAGFQRLAVGRRHVAEQRQGLLILVVVAFAEHRAGDHRVDPDIDELLLGRIVAGGAAAFEGDAARIAL